MRFFAYSCVGTALFEFECQFFDILFNFEALE